MTDQNRKTLRSFYCRDYLWEIFEQMTTDLGCSMDYLVNESMRLYARSRDYVQDDAPGAGGPGMGGPGMGGNPGMGGMGGNPGMGGSPGMGGGPGMGGSPGMGGGSGMGGGFGQPPQAPGYGVGQPNAGFSPMEHRTFNQIPPVQQQQRPAPQPPAPQPQAGGFSQQRAQLQTSPPPPPPRPSNGWQQAPSPGYQPAPPAPQPGYGGGSPMPPSPSAQPPLYLLFNNNRYVVDKDKFVIGRGSQQTDLTIRDGNISRKHCCIVFKNGSYFIKDLGSTNGVEYRGNRIESKKIEEGDIFYLCDYELRFTYRP